MRLPSSRKSWAGRILPSTLTLIAVALCACGDGGGGKGKWGRGNEEGERRDPLVEVVPVVRANISSVERSTGRIETRVLADVHAQVSEVCVSLSHDIGDSVREGDQLARLDTSRIALQLASANLAVEEARLTHTRNKLDREKRKADLARIEKYFDPEKPDESRVFTREAWEAAKLEFNKAENAVQSSDLALTKAEGEVAAAALNMAHTTIKAPISGVITERNLRANELVTSGAVAFRIADLTVLEVRLDVAEASMGGLRGAGRVPALDLFGLEEKPDFGTAQAAFLSVTAFPEERFLGYLDRISPVVDSARGMVAVTVRILLPRRVDETVHAPLLDKLDPDARNAVLATARRAREKPLELKPGMWVDARIATRLIEDATLVPGAAISGDAEVIWRVDPGKDHPEVGTARRIDVQGRRGVTSEGKFELKPPIERREGSLPVNAGDLIVVRGQNLLRDGQTVRLRDLSR